MLTIITIKLKQAQQGEYVMYAEHGPKNKLKGNWSGSHQLKTRKGDHRFTIKHLVSGKEINNAHPNHLRYYDDARLKVTLDMKNQVAHNIYGYQIREIVKHWLDINGIYKVQIQWKGFEDEEDFHSERKLGEMLEVIAPLTDKYIRKLGKPLSSKNKQEEAIKLINYLNLDADFVLNR